MTIPEFVPLDDNLLFPPNSHYDQMLDLIETIETAHKECQRAYRSLLAAAVLVIDGPEGVSVVPDCDQDHCDNCRDWWLARASILQAARDEGVLE